MKDETQVAENSMTKGSTSLFMKEVQMKRKSRFSVTSVRLVIIKKPANASLDAVKRGPFHTAAGNVSWSNHPENQSSDNYMISNK